MNPDGIPPRLTRHRRQVVGGMVALAIAGSVVSCSLQDVTESGRLGLSVDSEGDPVLLIKPCSSAVSDVSIEWGRTDDPQDDPEIETLGRWSARLAYRVGTTELNFMDPGYRWTGGPENGTSIFSRTTGSYLITAGGGDDVTQNLIVRAEDVEQLTATTALTSLTSLPSASFMKRSKFPDVDCVQPYGRIGT